ncbi:fibronectin type III domain-containing protein [Flavobacterium daemonense]|uniref:fibronectin type III domain-containing protein n=1 Tax=Flavobacterium daemonense TaxID=1393049 RepID=UPI001186F7A7|nr:fibronectin type III domain-containing protein [Flavobacterium daemonense]KAF2335555.1 T9SS type A sorting domain-containing protein [Flavobacterium daemonense]
MIITLRKIKFQIVLQILLLIPIFASANFNAAGHFSENFQSVDTEAPTAPKNATSPGSIVSTADISWTASTDNVGVKSYDIYSNNVLIGSVDAPTTTYRATGLAELTTYIFTIKAKDAAGNTSAASNEVIINTPDRTAPTKPADLTALEITGTSAKLSWSPSTDNVGVVGYNVYGSSSLLKQLDASTTTYIVGLSQNVTSRFSIKARDAAGNLSFTSGDILVKPLDIVPPTVPQNVVASEATATSIKLSWTASTDAESAVTYEIYKGGNILVGSSTTTSFTVTELTPNNAYLFTVKAKDASGNSSNASLPLLAESLDTILPTVPGSLTASDLTTTSVNLNWTASTDNREVTGYELYINGNLATTLKVLEYKTTTLAPNTTYSFYVKAKDAAGNASASSNIVTLKTNPTPPAYCVSQGYSQMFDEYMARVQIGTIDRKSNVSAISYTDATSLATELKKGETYSITVTPKEWISGKTQFGLRYAAWIDYNGDMDFYDAGELIWYQEVTTNSPVRGTFTVPANAITAKTRIRVTVRDGGAAGAPSPCGDYTDTYNYGETEDYTADIVNNTVDSNAPEAPTNLAASGTTWTTTNLSWIAPANNADITGYEIYKENILIGTSATTTFNVTGLRQGNTYLFTVKAKNANGLLSKSSVPVSVTTPKDNTSPTTPANLRATTVTASKITIAWDPSTNNGGGISYLVYYGDTLLTTVTNTSATIIELGNNIAYDFSVQAVDEFGNKSAKTSISVTTLKDTTPPTVAPQLTASETTSITTNLSWTAATDDEFITYYDIYNGSTLLYSVRGNVFQYNVSGLKEGTTYSFTVVARDGGSNKISSNVLSVTTVAIPKYCSTKATSDDGNKIYRVILGSINNNATSLGAVANYSDFTTQTTSLNPGQEYTITLQMLRSSGVDKNGLAVWIDLNGDKDFDDEGELVWSKFDNSEPFTSIEGKFTLPLTSKVGRTRMRVSVKRNEIPKPCEEFVYGEIEDYSIDIKKPIIESEAPTVPTNLTASNIKAKTVDLSWSASTDNIAVTGYEIYKNGVLAATSADTQYTVTGLNPETVYNFTVKAKDYSGNTSLESNSVAATTLAADVIAPTAPLNLSASNTTKYTTTLSWTASTDNVGVTGYEVYKDYSLIGTTSATTFNVTGLKISSMYTFVVKAKDEAGNVSVASDKLIITTQGQDVTPPTAPTNLVATNTTKSGTTLSWTASTDNVGVTAYNIYQGTYLLATTANTTFTITTLIPETRYSFTVKAVDADGNVSEESKNVIVDTLPEDSTPPTAPKNLTAETSGTTTVLSWTASTDNVGVTSYEIYIDNSLIGTSTTTTYTVKNLTLGRDYLFSVKAKDKAKNLSEPSNVVKVTTEKEVTYCKSNGTDTEKGHINKVHLNSIDNTTKADIGGYSDFTAMSTTIAKGQSNTITIETWTSNGKSNVFSVWIDLNGDKTFDSNELMWSSELVASTAVNGTFTIPNTAVNGSTRMRVSMKQGGIPTSCETFALGEVEDYTVNIQSSLSVEDHDASKNGYVLHPNPAHDKLFVIIPENKNVKYKITNLIGQNVDQGKVDETGIAISKLGSGIYILELNDGEKTEFKKFIKK